MPTITEVLDKIGNRVVDELKASLIQQKILASGALYKSVSYTVLESQENLQIFMADYWRWVEEGRRGGAQGKYVPIKALLQWFKDKAQSDSAFKNKFRSSLKNKKTRLSLAIAMSKSIKQKGIKARPFFEPVSEKFALNDIDLAIEEYLESLDF